MFENFKYRRKTRDFFRAHESREVGREDFLKILKGEVVNPRRLENSLSRVDWTYFVVGVVKNSPLNSWAGQTTGPNNYEIVEENSTWYGRFSCETSSQIIIPSEKLRIIFDPNSDSLLGKIVCSNYVNPLYLTGGFFQTDKVGDRILVSDINKHELAECFQRIYSPNDVAGSLNKLDFL
jgi:hypothetical protein